jgi:hypothetical protein
VSVELIAALWGALAGGLAGFFASLAVLLISRRLRHTGEIECAFPVWRLVPLEDERPDKHATTAYSAAGSFERAGTAAYLLFAEFYNSKDLDVALGDVRIVFQRKGKDVIEHSPDLLPNHVRKETALVYPHLERVGPVGTIPLRSSEPVEVKMSGFLHNLGGSDALDQLRAGCDRVVLRATREDRRTLFEQKIRDNPTSLEIPGH